MRYCRILEPSDLPSDWPTDRGLGLTRDMGTGWLKRNESLVLGVPSAVIPLETNFLINPAIRISSNWKSAMRMNFDTIPAC